MHARKAGKQERPAASTISVMIVVGLVPFALGYFMSYLLRAINQAIAPDLISEFDLSPGELGQLTSAYLFAFVIFQLPLGILLDRFGPKRVQVALLSLAALGVGAFTLANTLWQLTMARGLIGLGLSGCLMACFKAHALWLPQSRIALANSSAVAIGALGLAAATAPADWLAREFGWRTLFFCLAVGIGGVAALIALAAPKGGGGLEGKGFASQLAVQRKILGSMMFWRLAPMVAAVSGSYIAIQSLWAGRWLMDVNGLAREEASLVLLWMAVSFAAGSFLTGIIADVAQRYGLPLKYVIGGAFLLFALSQMAIIFRAPIPPALCWMLFGLSGQAANLAYADLATHFGRAAAGRAQSAANMLLFIFATIFQWGIGVILDFYPGADGGAARPLGYQVAFATVLAVQALAVFWYVRQPRVGVPHS